MERSLLIVAVNFNATQDTIEFVYSLSKLEKINQARVIIVENSNQISRDTELKLNLLRFLPELDFVETQENCNYFGSVNYAINQLALNLMSFDFFIISNVDILIKDSTFLSKLFSFDNPKVGVIAPTVFSLAQNKDQNPYKRLQFKKSYFYYYRIVYHHIFFTRMHEALADILRPYKNNNNASSSNSEFIYAPHGAFIIFLKSYFKAGCSIDYGKLLFCEEFFVSQQCANKGLRVFYEPALKVLHSEHIATGKLTGDYLRSIKLKSIKHFLKNF